MKKLLALLFVLVISCMSMFSCKWLGLGGEDGEGGGDGNSSVTDNPGKPEEKPAIEEDDGSLDTTDNIDPNGWTKVEK